MCLICHAPIRDYYELFDHWQQHRREAEQARQDPRSLTEQIYQRSRRARTLSRDVLTQATAQHFGLAPMPWRVP